MKIPAFINWLLKQDQRLEVAVIERYTEYKDYSGREETQVKPFLFSDPHTQSKIEHGVLVLGTVGQIPSAIVIPIEGVDKATKDYIIMILENSGIPFRQE